MSDCMFVQRRNTIQDLDRETHRRLGRLREARVFSKRDPAKKCDHLSDDEVKDVNQLDCTICRSFDLPLRYRTYKVLSINYL
jgi:hypothetical protein